MHLFAHHHHRELGRESAKETRGWVMNWGWHYDLVIWLSNLLLGGKLQALRHKAIDLAQLQRGETVLDVGCGTGTLALVAKECIGATGRVFGIDPGPRQIDRARSKAVRRGFPIDFQVGVIEQLPFPDQSFNAVLSTLMMHHLPDELKRQGLFEIARVLKPGGRLVIIDFKRPEERNGQPARLGAGEIGIQDQPSLLKEAGFSQIESGEIQFPRLPGLPGAGFALGRTG